MDKAEEKKLFVSTLPGALEALRGMQGAPRDDTILHRLLDTIKTIIVTQNDADRSGLLSFLRTISEDVSDVDSSVLVLALGIAAHLVFMTTVAVDQRWKILSLLDAVQCSSVLEDSSVGAAYFNSLTRVTACPAGLDWLEKNSVHVKTALSTLETARSVFLLAAAEDLVLASLTTALEASESCPLPLASQTLKETVQFLDKALVEMGKGRPSVLDHLVVSPLVSSFHQAVVQVVERVSECRRFCQWRCGDQAFTSGLARLALQHSSDKIRFSALKSVANLAAHMSPEKMETFLRQDVLEPLVKLVSEGAVERGVTVAAAFAKLSEGGGGVSCEALSTLHRLYALPHDALLGRHTDHPGLLALPPLVNATLRDKLRFGRLTASILHFVKQTENCEGLIQLVESASTNRDHDDWSSRMSSWPQGLGVVVTGNQRLLNALLHMLQQDDCIGLTLEHCTATLRSFVRIMKRPGVESRLYSQTCAAYLNVLQRQTRRSDFEASAEVREVMGQTLELLQRLLVARQWEVRDTSLEFLRSLVSIVSDDWMLGLMCQHRLLRDAWSCVKDGESYPRASAITMATSLVARQQWWAAFLRDCCITEASLVDEMVTLLTSDTEAFPRRAAVLLLTALFLRPPHSPSPPPSSPPAPNILLQQRTKICSIMTSAMADFDWEVKAKVLEFWEKRAQVLLSQQNSRGNENESTMNCEPKNGVSVSEEKGLVSMELSDVGDCVESKDALNKGVFREDLVRQGKRKGDANGEGYSDKLQGLLKDGFGSAVLAGADDYDNAVKQGALHILAAVAENSQLSYRSPAKAPKLESKVGKELQSKDTASSPAKTLKLESRVGKDADAITDLGSSAKNIASHDNISVGDQFSLSSMSGDKDSLGGISSGPQESPLSVDQFLHTVSQLNPMHLLHRLGPSSDEYERNPCSLLEDVMAAVKVTDSAGHVTLMSEDEFDDADDMFVDCY